MPSKLPYKLIQCICFLAFTENFIEISIKSHRGSTVDDNLVEFDELFSLVDKFNNGALNPVSIPS